MMNYFALLNTTQSFNIDLAALEAAYFSAQRQYHPDRFINKSFEEKLAAAHKSADINQAYETLKHPLKRAVHLLALCGITVLDDANSAKPDIATLTEIMELQEMISEGKNPDILGLIKRCESALEYAFKKNDIEDAKHLAIRLSYLYKLVKQPFNEG
jgi:molecular chaperone HscB